MGRLREAEALLTHVGVNHNASSVKFGKCLLPMFQHYGGIKLILESI